MVVFLEKKNIWMAAFSKGRPILERRFDRITFSTKDN